MGGRSGMKFRWVLYGLVVFAVGRGPAKAETVKCRETILRESAGLMQARLKAIGRCEDAVTSGRLPSGTNCASDPDFVETVTAATTRMYAKIERACGGADRTCGSIDDDTPASVG